MGRKKHETIDVSIDAKRYVKSIMKNYDELRHTCGEYEDSLGSIIKRAGIDMDAFSADAHPSDGLLVEVDDAMPHEEATALGEYLFAKEKLYILERGLNRLPVNLREAVQLTFIEGCDRVTAALQLCISEATLYRYEAKAIDLLAREADSYIRWKVKKLYI